MDKSIMSKAFVLAGIAQPANFDELDAGQQEAALRSGTNRYRIEKSLGGIQNGVPEYPSQLGQEFANLYKQAASQPAEPEAEVQAAPAKVEADIPASVEADIPAAPKEDSEPIDTTQPVSPPATEVKKGKKQMKQDVIYSDNSASVAKSLNVPVKNSKATKKPTSFSDIMDSKDNG